jgi:hypothetical protein
LIFKVASKIKKEILLTKLIIPIFLLFCFSASKNFYYKSRLSKAIKQYDLENNKFKQTILSQIKKSEIKEHPDIYYIILDQYVSNDYLQEICNFDNKDFIKELEDRRFYVAKKSLSNYGRTATSLPSSLNMNYLPHHLSTMPLGHMWRKNNVAFFLKNLGYEHVNIHENYFPEKLKNIKSQFKSFFFGYFNLFHVYLKNWTPLYPFLKKYDRYFRDRIKIKLKTLKRLAGGKSPKFVYAHFLTPHEPHVFDRNGNPLVFPKNMSDSEKYLYGHVEATKYINKEILKVIDKILEKSKIKPVIIIQGDHGVLYPGVKYPDKKKIYTNQILNAYLLSDNKKKDIHPRATPVNSFRIVFNRYFGTKLQLLDEKIYARRIHDKELFSSKFKLLKTLPKVSIVV